MIRLNIIIPCYNSSATLRRCFNSIKAFERENTQLLLTVIVINDGSTDGTYKFNKIGMKEFGDFVYIEQKNSGAGIARNTGLKFVQSNRPDSYILFLDADDELLPVTINIKNYNCIHIFNYMKRKVYKHSRFTQTKIKKILSMYNPFVISSIIFPSDEMIFFREELFHFLEDWDYWIRLFLLERKRDIEWHSAVLTNIHVTDNSLSSNYSSFIQSRAMIGNNYVDNINIPKASRKYFKVNTLYNSSVIEKIVLGFIYSFPSILNRTYLSLILSIFRYDFKRK